ncbi:MAG: DUF1501 domain-containing protein [Gammaproteobacteria bacterium]|nr:DUF1501 domain-containing protein [Gammaproteobacteria bacterium]
MNTTQFNQQRRNFLRNTAIAGGAIGIGALPCGVSFAMGSDSINKNIFVYIFLRGGPDWLSIIAPKFDNDHHQNYIDLRQNGVFVPDANLLSLTSDVHGLWGINERGAAFKDLFDNGDLAVIRATGLPFVNRSHFEAERFIELGTPGERFTTDGWLARHFQSAINLPGSMQVPLMTAESNVSFSLLGEPSVLALGNPGSFDLEGGNGNFEEELEVALGEIYSQGNSDIEVAGAQAIESLQIVEQVFAGDYIPDNGAVYPDDDIGDELLNIARLIKSGVGLRLAQADKGGWDTHGNQGNLNGQFGDRLQDVAEAVRALLLDLDVPTGEGDSWKDRTVVMLQGEFGRRVFDNADNGTDHGSGADILVAGGPVNGGQFYGNFLGLSPPDLFQNADVKTTTDYRNVFAEVLVRHLGNPELGTILPGFNDQGQADDEIPLGYTPLGFVNGTDLSVNTGPQDVIARVGFE